MSPGGPDIAMIPLRVTRAERIADDIHLFELRDPAGAALAGVLRRRARRAPGSQRADAQIFAVQRSRRAGPLRDRGQARGAAAAAAPISLIRTCVAGGEVRGLGAAQRFRAGEERGRLPLHRRRHRHHADHGDDPPSQTRRAAASSSTICTRSPAATAFRDELVGARSFAARSPSITTSGDPARALDLWPIVEKPQGAAALLLRSARPDAGGARHDRPLVAVRRAFRGLHRGGGSASPTTGRSRCAWRAPARRSRCRSASPSSRRCAPRASTCRARARAAPAAPAARGSSPGEADHRDLVLTDDERASHIMVCVSRARSDELVIDR